MKAMIIFSVVACSWAGSYLPVIWGGSLLSFSSLIFGAMGGFLGIWIGYKLGRIIGLD